MPESRSLEDSLRDFKERNAVSGKGALSLVLVITRAAKAYVFPLDYRDFVTEGAGQVKGLGRSAVQSILSDHGITKTLAEEGGRTSRGSMKLMMDYVEFLNKHFTRNDLDFAEEWWINQVKAFFAGKPFKISEDSSKSFKSIIDSIIKQAERRQADKSGTMYVGILLQHLVGAKLRIALPDVQFDCFGYSVADVQSDRSGDFSIHDSIVHVTTFPSEALLRKCKRNIDDNLRPIIVTGEKGVLLAQSLAESIDIHDRVEIFEITQFLSINLVEKSKFAFSGRKDSLRGLVEEYNKIVAKNETDPSLMIELK